MVVSDKISHSRKNSRRILTRASLSCRGNAARDHTVKVQNNAGPTNFEQHSSGRFSDFLGNLGVLLEELSWGSLHFLSILGRSLGSI
jgi:hypothetical protein